ncbi:MAG: hypothetical protein NT166_23625 [Candidatus Aminicenantes bacterium]|nr:hypothetical protein [Candidatus Aminicenantes bacterium]
MMKKKQEERRKAEESASLRVRHDASGFIYNKLLGELLCLRVFVAIFIAEKGNVTGKKFPPIRVAELNDESRISCTS